MNFQIETWRVQQYAQNVYQLSQQHGSRLAQYTRKEKFKGKAEFFDRIGTATAQKKVGRNTDTPNLDIIHSRRMLTTSLYEWATLIDRKDMLQNIHDPASEYAKAASDSLGRAMDDAIIAGALGIARTGEDGTTNVALPDADKIAAVSAGAISRMNVQALRKAKLLMDKAEVVGPRYFVINSDSLDALLTQTEVTSSDYNTVRALVQGEIDTFLGFKFIRSERVPLASVYSSAFTFNTTTGLYQNGGTALSGAPHSNFAFAGGALILGMNEDSMSRIDERNDKSYDKQVYASMDFGAVRMEEVAVVEVIALD